MPNQKKGSTKQKPQETKGRPKFTGDPRGESPVNAYNSGWETCRPGN